MRTLLESMIVAFGMYSNIPVPKLTWNDDNMKYSMCFFPWVGIVIGVLVLVWNRLGHWLGFGTPFYTAVMVLIPVLVTGGLHLDGLLDTADAISSHQTMERRLEILKDSNSGAFAVITCVCYFLLAYGTWTEISGRQVWILAVGFVLSRSLSSLSVVSFRCARNTGLAYAFANPAQKKTVRIVVILYLVVCAAAMCVISPVYGVTALAAAVVSFLVYRRISYKMFGGITGDLAGFFLQVCELAMAVAIVVVGRIIAL